MVSLPTGNVDGTLAIGLSFIFLAYFLSPFVHSSYYGVRAYRAWRAVESFERVEVTSYPMIAELFGGRGQWDAARMITVLLLAFSAASWVLELSMGLFIIHEKADFLTQPPPVFLNDSGSSWRVLNLNEIKPGYDGDYTNVENIQGEEAMSRYRVISFKKSIWRGKKEAFIDGDIIVASWSPESRPANFSYTGMSDDDTVMVDSVQCSSEGELPVTVQWTNETSGELEDWGQVLHCGEGPKQNAKAQPAIILTQKGTNQTHVIVEEAAQYPSFLYSVWTATDGTAAAAASITGNSAEIKYSFHVASTIRLAEAMVTGIVNGKADGGGCFGTLRAYSERDKDEPTPFDFDKFDRASPFGEKPESDGPEPLDNVEAITYGIKIDEQALVSIVCLLALSFVGITWSVYLRSSIGMDVYDRDQLLRAVSLQAQGLPDDPERHAAMRIYVQREKTNGNLNVIISESDGDVSGCSSFFLRRKPEADANPVPVADTMGHVHDSYGGAPLPSNRPRIHLNGNRTGFGNVGGARTGWGRQLPGRSGDFRYPASNTPSNTSPVPSGKGSKAGTPIPSGAGSAAVGGTPVTFRPRPGGSFVLAASPVPSNVGTPVRSNGGSVVGTPTLPPPPGGRRGGLDMVLGASPAHSNFSSITGTPTHSNVGSPTGSPVARQSSGTNFSHFARLPGGGGGGGGGPGGPNNFAILGRGASILFDESVCSASIDGGETDGDSSRYIETGASRSSARPQMSAFGGSQQGGVNPGRSFLRRSSPVPSRGLATEPTLGPPRMGPLTIADDAV
ncbi:unnamed protein product [Pylaiella littoralis]